MMKMMIDGKVCDEGEALVSALDHGFLYGIGLFETFRTYNGDCFLLAAHLERLGSGCRALGLRWELTVADIEQQVAQLLEVNQLPDAYVRLTVSAGMAALGMPSDTYDKPRTIIYMKSLPNDGVWSDPAPKGRALQLLKLRRNTPEGQQRYKSLNFMNNVLASRELQTYPWAKQAEGLLLTEDRYIAEGIVSNVFFIYKEKLHTPSLQTGILAGITRDVVITLAEKRRLPCEEGLYTWEQLLEADEIFITNSVQEITPILRLYDELGQVRRIGDGRLGKETAKLIQAYRDYIGGKQWLT